jgi:hypothetical protein
MVFPLFFVWFLSHVWGRGWKLAMATWAVGVAGSRASWQNLYRAIVGGETLRWGAETWRDIREKGRWRYRTWSLITSQIDIQLYNCTGIYLWMDGWIDRYRNRYWSHIEILHPITNKSKILMEKIYQHILISSKNRIYRYIINKYRFRKTAHIVDMYIYILWVCTYVDIHVYIIYIYNYMYIQPITIMKQHSKSDYSHPPFILHHCVVPVWFHPLLNKCF